MFHMMTVSLRDRLSHALLVVNSPRTLDTSCMVFTRKPIPSYGMGCVGWGGGGRTDTCACVGVNRDRLLAVMSGDVTQVRGPWLEGLLIFQTLLSRPKIAPSESIKRPSGDVRPSEETNPLEETRHPGEPTERHCISGENPALIFNKSSLQPSFFFNSPRTPGKIQQGSEWSTISAPSLRQWDSRFTPRTVASQSAAKTPSRSAACASPTTFSSRITCAKESWRGLGVSSKPRGSPWTPSTSLVRTDNESLPTHPTRKAFFFFLHCADSFSLSVYTQVWLPFTRLCCPGTWSVWSFWCTMEQISTRGTRRDGLLCTWPAVTASHTSHGEQNLRAIAYGKKFIYIDIFF